MTSTTPTAAEVPAATTPQGGEAPTGAAPTGPSGEAPQSPSATDDPATWDPERAKRTIEAQRASEKAARDELKAATDRLAEFERAQLTAEQQKDADLTAATTRAEKAETALAALQREVAFKDAAIEAGVKPKAVKAALAIVGDLDIDDAGNIANVDTVLEGLKADHDYLFGTAAPGTPTPTPPREPHTNPGAGTTEATGAAASLSPDELAAARRLRMSPEEYLANKE